MTGRARVEYGDWQTPPALAEAVLDVVSKRVKSAPSTIIEPTCGEGTFLVASGERFPSASLCGYELNPSHVDTALSRLQGRGAVRIADFFAVDWAREIAKLRPPVLVIGNPPWVTSADLGALGSGNHPSKSNFKKLNGLDALTGKSNFDVSEWMIIRLLQALSGSDATLAMLCKSAVARRVVEFAAQQNWSIEPGGLWRIDAKRHFDAAVDAVLFVCHATREEAQSSDNWPVYSSLEAKVPESKIGVIAGSLVADPDAHARTLHIVGQSVPEWRSGLKHDCARVMELEHQGSRWVNGLGEGVEVEAAFLYPLLKSSDIANARLVRERAVIVPQSFLGEDTSSLRKSAPKLWAYLSGHRDLLDGRKSSIYRGQPPFAIFGVGEYSFAPWKVAISGLYKRSRFVLVGPRDKRPAMLDDTCYFLPFFTEDDARRAHLALDSDLAKDFLAARIFWDAKRPIRKSILQSLDLDRLMQALADASR